MDITTCPTSEAWLTKIPNEVLGRIFLSLPWRSRLACLSVCKGWHSAAMSALYNSIPASALMNAAPTMAPFRKYSHLIKEIEWKMTDPTDPRLEDAMRFVTQSAQPQQAGSDASISNNRPRLTSLIYYGLKSEPEGKSTFLNILKHQPTLTSVAFVGTHSGFEWLPFDVILGCLPHLTTLKVSDAFCSQLNNRLMTAQGGNMEQDSLQDEHIDGSSQNNVAIESSTSAPEVIVRPPFALQRLSFPNLFKASIDPRVVFGALPNLTHLDLYTVIEVDSWFLEPVTDTSSFSTPWDNVRSLQFSETLVRNCPNLRSIRVSSRYATVAVDPQHYLPGARHNQQENKTPLEKSLPKIVKELYECKFRTSREALINLIDICGAGLTSLNISHIPRTNRNPNAAIADTPDLEVNSRDLQFILEECPNLVALVARGRVLHVKDMATWNAAVSEDPCSSSESSTNNSTETKSRPWACSKTLERLVIGIKAESDDPIEHKNAWIQLGQLHRINALELSETNLIPRISHGIGALSDLNLMTQFTIDRWTQIRTSSSSTEDTQGDQLGEKEKSALMLDSETVGLMARNWVSLRTLRLDIGNDIELEKEMMSYVQKEQLDGRMQQVHLSMTRLP
ncbi:hypothetical protein BGZ46_007541 [Entomortierella lignicola]|nr:hypothetical protein BGZ46_007541 [Entomortierella lignicola]